MGNGDGDGDCDCDCDCLLRATVGHWGTGALGQLALAHSVSVVLPLWSSTFRPSLLARCEVAQVGHSSSLFAGQSLGVHVSEPLQCRAANLVSIGDVPCLPYRYVILNDPASNQPCGPGWQRLVGSRGIPGIILPWVRVNSNSPQLITSLWITNDQQGRRQAGTSALEGRRSAATTHEEWQTTTSQFD
jgi:hypothetical protein